MCSFPSSVSVRAFKISWNLEELDAGEASRSGFTQHKTSLWLYCISKFMFFMRVYFYLFSHYIMMIITMFV